jgi:hypothetical protein
MHKGSSRSCLTPCDRERVLGVKEITANEMETSRRIPTYACLRPRYMPHFEHNDDVLVRMIRNRRDYDGELSWHGRVAHSCTARHISFSTSGSRRLHVDKWEARTAARDMQVELVLRRLHPRLLAPSVR